MALADLVVERETVEHEGKELFDVRGLSLADVVEMLKEHEEEVKATFSGSEVNFVELVTKAPEFVAAMICSAADERDQLEKVRILPMGVQLNALMKIWTLTAVSGDDLGNVIAALTQGAESLANQLTGQSSNESPEERANRLSAEGMLAMPSSGIPSVSSTPTLDSSRRSTKMS